MNHSILSLSTACAAVTVASLFSLAPPIARPAGALSPAVPRTQVFQYGAGYSGVADTWVSSLDWDTPPQHTVNYGRNELLALSRNNGDNPLIRFDVTAIPTNSAILTASLSLFNTTPGDCNTPGDLPRRIDLFRVLRAWDEGNQTASPMDAPGKHGATGDHAFRYYPGEGADVAWAARGMAAGADYAAESEGYADVTNPGWYTWTVTSLARAWVRGEQPNHGLVLRDATGYQVGNCDWRNFVSSQSASADQRPRLTVTYNPDVPFADAGADQANLSWTGAPIRLDGSASHDRPGGDDASLAYQWRAAGAAYGSALNGAALGAGRVISFTPDAAGEWDIELTVSSNLGETATDTVHLRLLRIPSGHPRIYLDAGRLAALQARAVVSNTRWVQLKAGADAADGDMQAKALVSQVTGQAAYCDQAVTAALARAADPVDWATKAGDIAVVYDWCHDRLTAGQQATLIAFFNTWGDSPHNNDSPGWGNYWPRYAYSYALTGLATYGDNARAIEWLDEFYYRRFRNSDLPLLQRIAGGGAWPEGMIYDWIANWPRAKAADAWRTATGEDLFHSTDWFRNRMGYLLLHRWPGQASQWGYAFHPYLSTGDTERNRGSIANYDRIQALILLDRFPDAPLADQLRAYVSAPPTDNSMSFLYHEEFLWQNPDLAGRPPQALTHYAPATGSIFMRSGWPGGAADLDASATYLTFQSGDHFTYHQHYDQNSFTLYKRGDLAVDSGVYSGDGRSDHDINYYVRTIAHNTLVVFNPAEDFSSARPDAYSNDGGQRTLYPASRSPQSIEDFDQHAVQYETGAIVHFEDDARYTYALGDATAAYNNPAYNQAMNTGLSGNGPKVSRFQREFVYLRPASQSADAGDYVVLLDRVGVVSPSFSLSNTKLLFHTLCTPTVDGTAAAVSPGETLYSAAGEATAASGYGKLFIRALLPLQRNIRRVGGRGVKAFWAFGANYDWHWSAGEPQPRPINDYEAEPYGEWRLEVEPADAALEHTFLTVLHPAVSDTLAMPATALISVTGMAGVHIADPGLNRVALFSSAPDGRPYAGTIVYSFAPTTRTLNMVFDLAPGAGYTVTALAGQGRMTMTLRPDAAGPFVASGQGVLTALVDGGVQPPRRVYLPLARVS